MATGTPRTQNLATPLRYRRRIDRLTSEQLQLLRRAFRRMMEISDDRGYHHWAGIHGLPNPIGCRNAHGTPFFLPWHRAYLYRLERALRDQVPDAMLAWWDWRTPANRQGRIPEVLREDPLASAEIDPAALQEGGRPAGESTERSPSSQQALQLPTREAIRDLIEIRDFDTFTDQLDSVHGGVHVWVGGHMSDIAFAAFDPIFWFHHGMVDRIWRLWQLRHGRAGPPESIWDRALRPFEMTVRDTLSVTRLGYDYAGATASRRTED